MTQSEFNEIVDKQIQHIIFVLHNKSLEYATSDRLHNFKESVKQFGGTESEACWGFMLKHLTSIGDIAKGTKAVTREQLDEKIGDAINYMILLKAILIEKMNTNPI